jgi:hypothetical protein
MISFDLPMLDELINGFKQNTTWCRPEDTSTQFRLRSQMMKNWRCFLIALLLSKIVAHYEDDVNVVWVALRGDVTPKDYEAFEFAGAASKFINAQQPARLQVGAAAYRARNGQVLRQAKPYGRRSANRHDCQTREAASSAR